MNSLQKHLSNLDEIGSELKKNAESNGTYFLHELQLIIDNKMNLDDSELHKEILHSIIPTNRDSIGYGIYWGICTQMISDFYYSTESSAEKDKIYSDMNKLSAYNQTFFNFITNEWVYE